MAERYDVPGITISFNLNMSSNNLISAITPNFATTCGWESSLTFPEIFPTGITSWKNGIATSTIDVFNCPYRHILLSTPYCLRSSATLLGGSVRRRTRNSMNKCCAKLVSIYIIGQKSAISDNRTAMHVSFILKFEQYWLTLCRRNRQDHVGRN